MDGVGATDLYRRWSASIFATSLEAMYSYPVYGLFSALMGFRWINRQTSYSAPTDVSGADAGLTATTDTADDTLNAYLPLIGVATSYAGFSAGAVGFPTAIGRFEQKESWDQTQRFEGGGDFDGGYFVEAFIDYAIPEFNMGGVDASFSVFAKWSALHAKATTVFREVVADVVLTPSSFNFYSHTLVIGGKATFRFETPDLLSFVR